MVDCGVLEAMLNIMKEKPEEELRRKILSSISAAVEHKAPLTERRAVEAVLCCSNLKEESSVSRKISKFAVQCFSCKKWRLISSQREYERIRFEMRAKKFKCIQIYSSSCRARTEITRDASNIWIDDHVGIPLTPEGFSRVMSLRGDNSCCDVYYKRMAGGSAKGPCEMRKLLPELDNKTADMYIKKNFSWQCPKVDSSMLCSGDQVPASE